MNGWMISTSKLRRIRVKWRLALGGKTARLLMGNELPAALWAAWRDLRACEVSRETDSEQVTRRAKHRGFGLGEPSSAEHRLLPPFISPALLEVTH